MRTSAAARFLGDLGSSVATTATIAKITVGELRRRGYDQNLALGSLAGAGTFGLMIPPSINMIVYGVLAEVSIAKMFAAGIIPGLLLAGSYSGYIAVRCLLNPSLAPEGGAVNWQDRFAALWSLGPIMLLIVIVLGSIYTGIATPSKWRLSGSSPRSSSSSSLVSSPSTSSSTR